MGRSLAAVARALDAAAVAWLRLRPSSSPAGPAVVGDEDLLVAPADLAAARRALRGLGFVELPAPGRGGHRFWWAFDETDGHWTKLDVVTELAFGPLGALRSTAAAGCLARRLRGPSLAEPAAEDAFWLLLLHDLLDRRELALAHRVELARTAPAATADHPLALLLAPACPAGWGPARILELVRAGDWATLEPLAPRIGRHWAAGRPVRARLELAANRVRRRLATLGLPPLRGLSVALLGPDGAGKSSALETFTGLPAVPVRRIYLGLYGTGLPSGRGGSGFARRALLAWRGHVAGRLARARGQLVVFDRHPLEVDRPGSGGRRARLRRWLLGHAIPRPDVILVLDAPAEVLAARRPEHDVADLARQREAYQALAASLRGAHLIDASAQPALVQRAVLAAIWQAAARRGGW
ncbi:MAG TPA: hypothetical protein VFW92_11120 [Candidatus Limnocylindrales bacterium]|nr:hypothetical protein [Candidatus Limnocylindrales bacterium]